MNGRRNSGRDLHQKEKNLLRATRDRKGRGSHMGEEFCCNDIWEGIKIVACHVKRETEENLSNTMKN